MMAMTGNHAAMATADTVSCCLIARVVDSNADFGLNCCQMMINLRRWP